MGSRYAQNGIGVEIAERIAEVGEPTLSNSTHRYSP